MTFSLLHFFYSVDSKTLNKFSILTRRIKISNMLCQKKLYKLAYIIIFFFLSATLFIVLTTKSKYNLIVVKTNKINSLCDEWGGAESRGNGARPVE